MADRLRLLVPLLALALLAPPGRAAALAPSDVTCQPHGLPGDTNCDGHVDQADFDALTAALFGGDNGCAGLDVNGDCMVSAADVVALLGILASAPTATPTGTTGSTPTLATTPTVSRTASPNATPTASPSVTSSPSVTRSPTATQTVTITVTPGGPTLTRTRTGTPTGTATNTRVSTHTPTATVTATVTNTGTRTGTATLTRTPSSTASVTNTRPTQTETATGSPTRTVPSATPSATGTDTRTPMPSRTPTNTSNIASPTVDTRTVSPTATPTRTATVPSPTNTRPPSPTATSTNSPRSTITPTGTLSPTNTRTLSPSATATGSVAPSSTASSTPTRTPTPTGTDTRTPLNTRTATPVNTATNTRTPSSTATNTPTRTNTRTATETLTPSNTRTPSNTATPAPTRTVTPSMTSTPTRTPTRTATPTIPRPFGAEVVYFGIATGDGHVMTPIGQTNDPTPIPIFTFPNEFGMQIVVEARRGTDGAFPDTCGVFAPGPGGVDVLTAPCSDGRAAVQILTDRPLGNGHPDVCASTPGNPDGVPAVPSLTFDDSQMVDDAIVDLACRFQIHNSGDVACTLDDMNNFAFVRGRDGDLVKTDRQYCAVPVVSSDIAFQHGITRLKVQVEDAAHNTGNQVEIAVQVP